MDKINQICGFFRSISVHFYRFFCYFCTGNNKITSTSMAGTVKDMKLIKQVLQLKQLGESNPETQGHETQRQVSVSLSNFHNL